MVTSRSASQTAAAAAALGWDENLQLHPKWCFAIEGNSGSVSWYKKLSCHQLDLPSLAADRRALAEAATSDCSVHVEAVNARHAV